MLRDGAVAGRICIGNLATRVTCGESPAVPSNPKDGPVVGLLGLALVQNVLLGCHLMIGDRVVIPSPYWRKCVHAFGL